MGFTEWWINARWKNLCITSCIHKSFLDCQPSHASNKPSNRVKFTFVALQLSHYELYEPLSVLVLQTYYKCFLFGDLQTKSILTDIVGKNTIQISINGRFLYPSSQSQASCTTIREANKARAYLKDACVIYKLLWLVRNTQLVLARTLSCHQRKYSNNVDDIEHH